MSLDSRIFKAGALCLALALNPLSPEKSYAQDKDVSGIVDALMAYEKSIQPTAADIAKIDQWTSRIVNELYFPLTKKYDAKAIDSILRGYANLGSDADGSKIRRINSIAEEVFSDSDIKTMPKDIAYSVIIASGFGIKSPREMIMIAKNFYEKTIALHKEYDVAKNPQDLCAVIEAAGSSFFFPDSIYNTFFKYDFAPIDNKDFIRALAFKYSKNTEKDSRPARDIGTSDIYDTYDIGLSFFAKGILPKHTTVKEFQASLRYNIKQSKADLYRIRLSIFFEGEFEEDYAYRDLIMPLIGALNSENFELTINKMRYAVNSLKGKGINENVIRAMMQSYRL